MVFPSSEFDRMMPDTITVQAASTVDKYGKQAWAVGASVRCRLVFEARMFRDADGRDVNEIGRAITFGHVSGVSPRDRVVLPDGRSPVVTSVTNTKDEDGSHHVVIGFGA
jgi:hypothetical protein